MLSKNYVLNGHDVVPEPDFMVWAQWFETGQRSVGHTVLDQRRGIYVSTVFLGMDHRFIGEGEPIIFETMIFGTSMDGYQRRYTSWRAAEIGHADAVGDARRARQVRAEPRKLFRKRWKEVRRKLSLPARH